MKRIILVYNPKSSKARLIEREVLEKVRELNGWTVGKYEIKAKSVDKNSADLAKILMDGDLVVTAGGDGTSAVGVNGCMLSEKDVCLGVLGYGNFNDMARMLGTKKLEEVMNGETVEMYPLEALVNDKHWRYASCYFTMGMFAESTRVFDDEKTRNKLKKGGRGMIFSLKVLARWYFKNRKREFLKDCKVNGEEMKEMTDYMAVNSGTVAKIMKGGKWFLKKDEFWGVSGRLGGFGGLVRFMVKSVLVGLPGEKKENVKIEFAEPTEFEMQAEGEYERMKEVVKVEFRKSKRGLKVKMAQ